jgi:hypothetical protein
MPVTTANKNPDDLSETPTNIAIQMTILNERLLPLIELVHQHDITLRGEGGCTGLVGDVNDLKNGMGTIRKLCWLAMTSGIGTLITMLAQHLKFPIP